MSEIVGSEDGNVAQIIEALQIDRAYKNYDGRKVFQFLFDEIIRSDFVDGKESIFILDSNRLLITIYLSISN